MPQPDDNNRDRQWAVIDRALADLGHPELLAALKETLEFRGYRDLSYNDISSAMKEIYTDLDPLFEDPQRATEQAAEYVDLAGAFLLVSASVPFEQSVDHWQPMGSTIENRASLVSLTLLDRLSDAEELTADLRCDIALDQAAIVAISPLAYGENSWSDAIEKCPDDPTPRVWSETHGLLSKLAFDDTGKPNLEGFHSLREQWPNSPSVAGATGYAELISADNSRGFTQLNLYREAVTTFAEARATVNAPELVIGQARAYSALGDKDRSRRLLEELEGFAPLSSDLWAAAGDILADQGNHERALDLYRRAEQAQPRQRIQNLRLTASGCRKRTPWDQDPPPTPLVYNTLGFPGISGGTYSHVSAPTPAGGGCGGGGLVHDTSLIPDFVETNLTRPSAMDINFALARELAVIGGEDNLDEARMLLDRSRKNPSTWSEVHKIYNYGSRSDFGPCQPDLDKVIALLDSPGTYLSPDTERSCHHLFGMSDDAAARFHTQNLLRWAGKSDAAENLLTQWKQESSSPLFPALLGQVRFLNGDYSAAAAYFDEATRDQRSEAVADDGEQNERLVEQALILAQKGLSEQYLGQPDEALSAYQSALSSIRYNDRELADLGSPFGPAYPYRDRALAVQTQFQIAMLSAESGDEEAAYREFRRAYELGIPQNGNTSYKNPGGEDTFISGAVLNNVGLLAVKFRDLDLAKSTIDQLLETTDPDSPIYLETKAWFEQEAGNQDSALTTYSQVLDNDTSSFTALNNKAVILASNGNVEEAIDLLRRAVGVKPDYALGWANLSYLLAQQSTFWSTVQSQGAWARAVSADPELRGSTHSLSTDRSIHITDIDVSKPAPADWSFARAYTPPRQSISWTMIALGCISLLFTLLRDELGGRLAESILSSDMRARLRRLTARFSRFTDPLATRGRSLTGGAGYGRIWTHIAFSVVASILILLHFIGDGGLRNIWIFSLLVFWLLALILIIPVSRLLMSRYVPGVDTEPETVRHVTWWPFMGVGIGLSLVSLAFAPVSVLDDPENRHQRVRIAGIIVFFGTTLLLLALSLTNVPTMRGLATACLLILGSLTLPTQPIDGAFIRNRVLSAVLGGFVLLAGILIEIGIV
ncbi:tetratricopeptide repeat protein [Corynebacterium sp. P5848]|uniref:tetratricopeptide repeat protein n=1 Tax=Corynebacterium marambiense TaxID=2765364 RepID=UPI002260D47B|nr:tetratricopeptide repeat protein [Corynebacterium marambiense]MCX7543246.1 tetratricopeptide repeat protein [Corynebacterium marambiense]